MGFINTGNTLRLTAYLTQKGRELLLNGNETDITAKYFGLGDSDTNYNIEIRNDEGCIPDLTGDNSDCILSLANNVGIKYNVVYSDAEPQVPTSTSEVRLKRPDNDKYYNVLDCFINLDSIGRYMLYHNADNLGNINGSKVNASLAPIFTNLFKQVDVLTKPTENPLYEEIDPVQAFDFEMMFDPNIYKSLVNTYLDGNSTVNQIGNAVVSPIVLTFSSRLNTGTTISEAGSGSGSIGIIGRELGYVYKAFDKQTYNFYNAAEIEGVLPYTFFTDENNQLLNKYTTFDLGARLISRNKNSGVLDVLFYRANNNLTNISETNMSSFNNELKNSNQHLKLFKSSQNEMIINGNVVPSTSIMNDGLGLVQKEIINLRDFIQISPYFNKTNGTNEYRTSKLTFNIYPKGVRNIKPATLNLVFKFNEDVLLDGDLSYKNITDEGDKKFVTYEFVPTNNVYKNVAKTASFTRNNCGSGYNGSVVDYIVPKGKYTGSTQAQADLLAEDDIATFGQSYANSTGTCNLATVYYSSAFYGNIMKNDCPYPYYGTTNYVNVPQGQFTSMIDQYDADIQAFAYAQTLGNNMGSCVLTPEYGGGCLLTGERIYINENDTVAVEDIKVGDFIYTAHEKTKELGYYKVTYAEAQTVDSWYYIITEDDRTISCSPTHLFMVDGIKTVVTSLASGDKLMVLEDDTFINVIIKDIIPVDGKVTIHKIEVDGAHTYITENKIWHHNRKIADPYDTLPSLDTGINNIM